MKFDLSLVPIGASRHQGHHFQVHLVGNLDEGQLARCSGEALELQSLFTRVVEAYSKGSLEGVRDIVARPLHDRLLGEVAERDRLDHVLSSRLVEFVSAEIVHSEDRLLGGWKDVRFVSRMVVALLGANGTVLAGNPVQVRMLSEVWTLKRSSAAGESRWLITAMAEDE
tara:strand:- start:20668 stop:21174 length:507 start_codon:yes stop_codon:yes gene_type:complete